MPTLSDDIASFVRHLLAKGVASGLAPILSKRAPKVNSVMIGSIGRESPWKDLVVPTMSEPFAERVLNYVNSHQLGLILSFFDTREIEFVLSRVAAEKVTLAIPPPGYLELRLRIVEFFERCVREERKFAIDILGDLAEAFRRGLDRGLPTRETVQTALFFSEFGRIDFLEQLFQFPPQGEIDYLSPSPSELRGYLQAGVKVLPLVPRYSFAVSGQQFDDTLVNLGLYFKDLGLPFSGEAVLLDSSEEATETLFRHGVSKIYATKSVVEDDQIELIAFPQKVASRSWANFLMLAHRIQIGYLDFA